MTGQAESELLLPSGGKLWGKLANSILQVPAVVVVVIAVVVVVGVAVVVGARLHEYLHENQ